MIPKGVQDEILRTIAGFLRYKVQDNRIIECTKEQKEEIRAFLREVNPQLEKHNAVMAIQTSEESQASLYCKLKHFQGKTVILLCDTELLPSKETDFIFYFVSRLGEMSDLSFDWKCFNLSLIILTTNRRAFYKRLTPATMSSLGLREIRFAEEASS